MQCMQQPKTLLFPNTGAMEAKAACLLESFSDVTSYEYSCTDTSQQFVVENPATGKPITIVQAGSTETTASAVEASQAAFQLWQLKSRQERCTYLLRAADELQKHTEELTLLLCLENGKPYKDASFDIMVLLGVFRYFGSIADKLPSEFFDQGNIYSAVIYEPHGVCAAILPFNWPPVHVAGKVAPCLAAGNTMVLKPGEQSPLTAMRIVNILQSVFPPDVLLAVPGLGPDVPDSLVRHPLVKMVSLTGSTASGIKVASSAAQTLTSTALELGGKNAFIVFEDADLDAVVKDAIDGAFFNKGEACTAASRVFVHSHLYEEFVRRAAAATKQLRTGNGLDESTHVGPIASRERYKQVLDFIRQGRDHDKATLVAEGSLPTDVSLSDGFYVAPTVFSDVTPSMRIAREEIFGPVLCIGTFEDESRVINMVNDSDYGLFAGVYTADFPRALRVARRLEVGVVLINNYFRALVGTPFGGVKGSGNGREHWVGTLREWSRIKNIRFPTGQGIIPVWRGATDTCDE